MASKGEYALTSEGFIQPIFNQELIRFARCLLLCNLTLGQSLAALPVYQGMRLGNAFHSIAKILWRFSIICHCLTLLSTSLLINFSFFSFAHSILPKQCVIDLGTDLRSFSTMISYTLSKVNECRYSYKSNTSIPSELASSNLLRSPLATYKTFYFNEKTNLPHTHLEHIHHKV